MGRFSEVIGELPRSNLKELLGSSFDEDSNYKADVNCGLDMFYHMNDIKELSYEIVDLACQPHNIQYKLQCKAEYLPSIMEKLFKERLSGNKLLEDVKNSAIYDKLVKADPSLEINEDTDYNEYRKNLADYIGSNDTPITFEFEIIGSYVLNSDDVEDIHSGNDAFIDGYYNLDFFDMGTHKLLTYPSIFDQLGGSLEAASHAESLDFIYTLLDKYINLLPTLHIVRID